MHCCAWVGVVVGVCRCWSFVFVVACLLKRGVGYCYVVVVWCASLCVRRSLIVLVGVVGVY